MSASRAGETGPDLDQDHVPLVNAHLRGLNSAKWECGPQQFSGPDPSLLGELTHGEPVVLKLFQDDDDQISTFFFGGGGLECSRRTTFQWSISWTSYLLKCCPLSCEQVVKIKHYVNFFVFV